MYVCSVYVCGMVCMYRGGGMYVVCVCVLCACVCVCSVCMYVVCVLYDSVSSVVYRPRIVQYRASIYRTLALFPYYYLYLPRDCPMGPYIREGGTYGGV